MSDKTGLKNLSYALRYHAARCPDKPYIIINKQEQYTYYQVNRFVDGVCAMYKSLNVQQGDIISVLLNNNIEYIVLYLASLRYGVIFNPYPYNLESKDLKRYLANIKPKIVFCQKNHYNDLKEAIPYNIYLINKDFIAGLDPEADPWNDFIPEADSPACLYYSSGTTGNPKNILISHRNMVVNISSLVRSFCFNVNDIHLIILPLGHTASINYSFLPCTLCGATIVLADSFWKIRSQFWSLIKNYGVTYVELVPTILIALLNTPYKKEDYSGIESLRFIGCGSSTLPKECQIRFMKKYGIKVANLYGLSETGPTHIDYPLEENWEPGSIGIPLDTNEVLIMNERGQELDPGDIGEIAVKGENVFIDYYSNHNLYKQVVLDGYFYTGDLGHITDGKHYFIGRKKELIIKGGINIAPDEIDEIIYKLNDVAESLTIGKPDEYLGEKICTHIVLNTGSQLSGNDIIAHCKNYLSRDKIPDTIMFVDRIPKGHSGKFLRKKVGNI